MKILLLTLLCLSMLIACSKPKDAGISNTKQKITAGISAENMEKYFYFKTIKRKNIMQEQFIKQVEKYFKYKRQKIRTDYQQDFIERINIILDDLKC